MPVPSGPAGSEHRRERERERGRQNTVHGAEVGHGTHVDGWGKAGSQPGVNTSPCSQSSI